MAQMFLPQRHSYDYWFEVALYFQAASFSFSVADRFFAVCYFYVIGKDILWHEKCSAGSYCSGLRRRPIFSYVGFHAM